MSSVACEKSVVDGKFASSVPLRGKDLTVVRSVTWDTGTEATFVHSHHAFGPRPADEESDHPE